MKRVIPALVLAISLLLMSSCGSNESSEQVWPHGGLLDMIPMGADTCINTYENADDAFVKFKGDEDKFAKYIDECSKMGFTVDTKLDGHNYDAYNGDGYSVHIVCFTSGSDAPCITVDLYKPRTNDDLHWPAKGAAAKLPKPNKEKGKVSLDEADEFRAYVGEMSNEDFASYVDRCMGMGFVIDYTRRDDYFSAKDERGNELLLRYVGFQTMYIDLTLHDGSSNSADEENSNSNNGDSSAEKKESESNSSKNSEKSKDSSSDSSGKAKSGSSSSSSSSADGKSSSESGEGITESKAEAYAIKELYSQLNSMAEIYTNLDPGSCKYKIGTIERSKILDQWEVNGTVYYVDKYGSVMKAVGGYSQSFTVYVSDSGSTTCNGF